MMILPGAPQTVDMETESRAAVRFLESVSEADRIYIRLTSTYSLFPEELQEFERLFLKLQWRHLTLNPNRKSFPVRVPGSETLWWFDLRSFNWNDTSWRAVALRDKTFREPGVEHPTAERLRNLIGENQPENFHVIAVVDALGLFRRTYQTFDASDYYDLLFSEQRFPVDENQFEWREVLKFWKGGVDPADGKEYPPGWYAYLRKFQKRKFVDFPKNYDQWLSAFLPGLSVEEYERTVTKLKGRRGAIIKGMEDTTDGYKSFVAKNNRAVWMEQFPGALGSIFGQTFDVKKTSGKRDLEENAFTDQGLDKGRVFRDGGELLITHPAGDALASLVINDKGDRVEFVPNDIAIHTRDPRDPTVRNGPMVCMNCHAPAYGWIPMPNIIEKASPDEVDVKFKKFYNGSWVKDKQAAEDFDAFFIDWQDGMKPGRDLMKAYWAQATGTSAKKYKDGWTGEEFAKQTIKWKHKADNALDIRRMAKELGAPEPIVRLAGLNSTLRRAVDAVRKEQVPRPTWDEDVFPELVKLLAARREEVIPRK